MENNWRSRLKEALPQGDLDIRFDEPMAKHTTFRIGGPADALLLPGSMAEIEAALAFCKGEGVPLTVIGNGSNLLVRDGGIRGLVIRLQQNFSAFRFEGEKLFAQAGCKLGSLAEESVRRGWAGLEYACGIPATVGGAVVMNAGAYGGSLSDSLFSVRCLDEDMRLIEHRVEPGDMGYRKTIFGRRGWVVLEACFLLRKDQEGKAREKLEHCSEQRRAKQPLNFPSAGSVFKRPEGHFAGQLIQEAGCKGLRVGDAEVSTLHAGFIINRGHATAQDVEALIGEVQRRVYAASGVQLETEIKILGEAE